MKIECPACKGEKVLDMSGHIECWCCDGKGVKEVNIK